MCIGGREVTSGVQRTPDQPQSLWVTNLILISWIWFVSARRKNLHRRTATCDINITENPESSMGCNAVNFWKSYSLTSHSKWINPNTRKFFWGV